MKPEEKFSLAPGAARIETVPVVSSWKPLLEVELTAETDLALWILRHELAPDARFDWRLTACIDCLTESEPHIETSTYVSTSGECRAALLARTARSDASTWLLEGRIVGSPQRVEVRFLARAVIARDPTETLVGPAAG